MRKELSQEQLAGLPREPGDEFYCKIRKRRLTLQRCLEDYVNANALNKKSGACWQCDQGNLNRQAYSTK